MTSEAPTAEVTTPTEPQNTWFLRGSWLVAGAWAASTGAMTTRSHLVLLYDTYPGIKGWQEILVIHNGVLLSMLLMASLWALAIRINISKNGTRCRLSFGYACLASLPLLLSILRSSHWESIPEPSLIEPLWAAFWSGMAVYILVPPSLGVEKQWLPRGWESSLVGIAAFAAFAWFWYQSHLYFINFRLGFNDFGHFTQRVASTASGNGFLLESPILPPFWDHFNPGLLLLVPFWWLWPSVEWIFALQGICLASSAWILMKIARSLGHSRLASSLWGVAWLLHPSLSQMNISFTYGWHPISLAMPLLLMSIWSVIERKPFRALVYAIVAASFEETVIIVIALWAAVRACRLALHWIRGDKHSDSKLDGGISLFTWIATAVVSSIAFVLVYRLSGLAEFQTARFSDLGNGPFEILASPIQRPQKFWGQIFQYRTLGFLGCLLVPLFPLKLKNAHWVWGACLIPLGVLIMWQHIPAKSIGFHYVTTLLPILWLASMMGSTYVVAGQEVELPSDQKDLESRLKKLNYQLPTSLACFTTCLITSFFLGQMPWSSPTLGPQAEFRRLAGSPEGQWLLTRIGELRKTSKSVLATQRVASHFVGVQELETMGQLSERRTRLLQLTPNATSVLHRYDTLVLDRLDYNAATQKQVEELAKEAISNGFRLVEDQYQVLILQREPEKPSK